MSLKSFRFARLMDCITAAFATTLPITVLNKGSEDGMASHAGFPAEDVSSLSLALSQMGLCKRAQESSPSQRVSPIA